MQKNQSKVVSKITSAETISSECSAKTNTPAKDVSNDKKVPESSQKTQPTVVSIDSSNVEARLEGPGKEYVQTMSEMKLITRLMKKSVSELQAPPYQGITLVSGNGAIAEQHRFTAEGVAQDDECKAMLHLANVSSILLVC